jgi:hypothetical protein
MAGQSGVHSWLLSGETRLAASIAQARVVGGRWSVTGGVTFNAEARRRGGAEI